jgi:hypothetical protein
LEAGFAVREIGLGLADRDTLERIGVGSKE